MSYDGWIIQSLPNSDQAYQLDEIGNYTSNVSRMWRWCLSAVMESPTRLSDTEGWTCEKAAPILEKAVDLMKAERSRLETWNPQNGWGDYEGALAYLERTAELARKYAYIPDARLSWWV